MKESNELQHLFDIDLEQLNQQVEAEVEFIEQNHFGDMLIEETQENNERFRLWKSLEDNGGGIEIEHCGRVNRYTWETIYKSN